MKEKLLKFYAISKTKGNKYLVRWALFAGELHLDGTDEISSSHELYPFIKWACKNPPEFPAMFPESVVKKLNKVFLKLKKPTWESLLESKEKDKALK